MGRIGGIGLSLRGPSVATFSNWDCSTRPPGTAPKAPGDWEETCDQGKDGRPVRGLVGFQKNTGGSGDSFRESNTDRRERKA